jgi:hypothetical protein
MKMIETDQLKGLSLENLQAVLINVSEMKAKAWHQAYSAVSSRDADLIYSMAIDIKALDQVQAQVAEALKEKEKTI